MARQVRVTLAAAACALTLACGRSSPTPSAMHSPAPADKTPSTSVPGQSLAPVATSSSSTPTGRSAACSLISRAEMTEILGASIGTPNPDEDKPGTTSCLYPPADANSRSQAEVTIEWEHGDTPSFERLLVNAFGGVAIGRQVAHDVRLGDEASYSREGVLSARTGQTLVTITVPMRPDSEEKALAIGKKLFERLGAATASASPKFPDGLFVGDECPDATGDTTEAESARIPLKAGLTLSHIWIGRAGDYEHECLTQVVAATRSYVDVTESCPIGANRQDFTGKRRLCRGDLRDSFFYRTGTAAVVPPVVSPATMFSLSTRSFLELKTTGHTRHRYIEIADAWRTSTETMREDTDGTLHAGPLDREPYKVIVNDRLVELSTIVGMSNPGTRKQTVARVLDDQRFPLVLDYEVPGDGFQIRFTKISYPTEGDLEKHLAVEKRVDVYGIYFDFASDRLRPESTPVLSEIAGALANNAGWTLTINGHTDNIGGESSNLELSRRRSESVRRALVERYHITPARLITAGFGASQPKESNATAEGRGKNRRVELVRQ